MSLNVYLRSALYSTQYAVIMVIYFEYARKLIFSRVFFSKASSRASRDLVSWQIFSYYVCLFENLTSVTFCIFCNRYNLSYNERLVTLLSLWSIFCIHLTPNPVTK